MHTEHLQNVRPVRVIAGWLVAMAVTALLALALEAAGLVYDPHQAGAAWWSALALAAGFFAGGFFAGFSAMKAPLLHAVGIAVTTVIAAWLLNVLLALLATGSAHLSVAYEFEASVSIATALVIILAAAIIGALLGYNIATRGKPGLGKHEPIDV